MAAGFHNSCSTTDDPYKILGVARDASQDDIRKAYRKLALQYHPDKCNSDTEFKKINNAYQILNDPDKRRLYDLCSGVPFDSSTSGVDLNALFSKLLYMVFQILINTKFRKEEDQKKERTIKSKNLHIEIDVNLADIYMRQVKKISVKVNRYDEETKSFKITTVPLYLSLLNFQDEYVYKGMGDESVVGGDVVKSDVILHVNVIEDAGIRMDKLLFKYDLYIERDISLYQYYYGYREEIDFFGNLYVIEYSYDANRYVSNSSSVVIVDKGKGLPYFDEKEQKEKAGDLYLYFRIKLPKPPISNMEFQNFMRAYFNDEASASN